MAPSSGGAVQQCGAFRPNLVHNKGVKILMKYLRRDKIGFIFLQIFFAVLHWCNHGEIFGETSRRKRLGQKFGSATSKWFWSYCDIGALSSKEDKRPEMLTSVKRRRYYGRFFHFHSSLKGGQNVMICHSQSKVGHTTIIYWLQYSTMYNYSRTVGTYRDLGTGPWFLNIF